MIKGLLGGLVAGLVLPPLALVAWFALGRPPVAVADKPFPYERKIARMALHARIDREAPKEATMTASPEVLAAGARIYREQCASCHGAPGRASSYGPHMFPRAPQLWEKHGDAVGVSDDPPDETYWKVRNGIRLTGMPAYDRVLSDAEMWQVSLLLANADKPLTEPLGILAKAQP